MRTIILHEHALAAMAGAVRCIRSRVFLGALALALPWAAVPAASGSAASTPPDAAAAPLFEQPPPGTPNFTGKWLMVKPPRHLLTRDGHEPPLTAVGKAEYAKHRAALAAGEPKADPIAGCLMHGVPRLLYAPYPFLILQTTRDVNFVHEVNHTFRNIYWGTQLPEDPDPTYLGSSMAHWDGSTLVIDSIGFNDSTWLDYAGLPHGEKLKVEERYTLSGRDAIEGVVTITDPDYYSAPWSTRFTLKRMPGMDLAENVCTDTHRM